MLARIADGRTDLVFPYVDAGDSAASEDGSGVSLIKWCAYYGDVSAIRYLLANGESLESLGHNFDLGGACFHGHWQLCQFLLEAGADVNDAHMETGETPLHSAVTRSENLAMEHVVAVLIHYGANPNTPTRPSIESGSFMRDCRTRGETPLHRAAAFGNEETLDILLEAGAKLDVRDQHGDSPLSWASWHKRPTPILHKLCFGDFKVHPDRRSMSYYLLGQPQR